MKQAAAIFILVLILSATPVLILFRGTQGAAPELAPTLTYRSGQRLQSNKDADAPAITLVSRGGPTQFWPNGGGWIVSRGDSGPTWILHEETLAMYYSVRP